MCDLYVVQCTRVLVTLYFSLWVSFLSLASESNMPTPLEIKREENRARNLKLLADITGRNKENNAKVEPIAQRNPKHKSTPQKRTSLPKKRVPPASDGETEESRPFKRARSKPPKAGLRRSSRNVGKTHPDYQAESQTQLPRLVA